MAPFRAFTDVPPDPDLISYARYLACATQPFGSPHPFFFAIACNRPNLDLSHCARPVCPDPFTTAGFHPDSASRLPSTQAIA